MSDLDFDWEIVSHKSVLAVVGRNGRLRSNGSPVFDAVAFVVGELAVVLTVTAETDEILIAHESAPDGHGWDVVTTLGDAVGKPLGWCWVGRNYRGYRDSFTLALGDVVPDALQPRLTLLAEGCSLSCFRITPVGV